MTNNAKLYMVRNCVNMVYVATKGRIPYMDERAEWGFVPVEGNEAYALAQALVNEGHRGWTYGNDSDETDPIQIGLSALGYAW